jgi:GTP cyclohydrolase I
MEDVQSRLDDRQIAIDEVGVAGLRYPIVVLDRAKGEQHTVATIAMSVDLPQAFKGTHMSRFLEVLNEHRGEMTMRTLPILLRAIQQRLCAQTARIEVSFPYFLERVAPVTGARALMDYVCTFRGERCGERDTFLLRVEVPVTTLCPCSKAISDYGAHNQRGVVTIEVGGRSDKSEDALIWIEELVEIAERSASAPVYPLLKRPDERHVTMQAYDNPVFVEDVVRNVAVELNADARVDWFKVRAVNDESIHNHSAFAKVQSVREPGATRERTLTAAEGVSS